MLKIKVDLIPHGVHSRRETLAEVDIINNLSGDLTKGNYNVTVVSKDWKGDSSYQHFHLDGIDRSRDSLWLLYKALEKRYK